MKRYTSKATKLFAIISLTCVAVLLIGITLLFAKIENIGFPISLTVGGGLLGILFLACFVAEKSRTLIIDADRIILPRGVIINGKTIFQKTVIQMSEIKYTESSLHKGDRIISKDTYFHTLKLKDGRKATVTLYAYGKEAEKEILEIIKKNSV